MPSDIWRLCGVCMSCLIRIGAGEPDWPAMTRARSTAGSVVPGFVKLYVRHVEFFRSWKPMKLVTRS